MSFDPLTLALLGASAGFLDPRGGMMGGFHGAMQGYQAGVDAQDRRAQQQLMARKLQKELDMEATLKSLTSDSRNADPIALGNALLGSGNLELMKQGANLLKTKQAKSFIKGLDHNGQPTYYTGYSTGEVSPTGVTPAEKLSFQNLGNQTVGVDPYTGKPKTSYAQGITPGQSAQLAQSNNHFNMTHALNLQKAMMDYNPQFQAQKAGEIAASKAQALNKVQANSDLPKVIQQGEQTISLVDDLLNHPGFKVSVGKTAPIGSAMSFVPGTDAASFDIALKQLKGKQFLEAFESLKGGGQITQIEGEKATQALSRMEKANTEDEFIKASREFQSIIKAGIGRAKAKAGMPMQQMTQPMNNGWSVQEIK